VLNGDEGDGGTSRTRPATLTFCWWLSNRIAKQEETDSREWSDAESGGGMANVGQREKTLHKERRGIWGAASARVGHSLNRALDDFFPRAVIELLMRDRNRPSMKL
jgi:hypothetical protein